MHTRPLVVLVLAAMTTSAWGGGAGTAGGAGSAADAAEAKRRGITVAQLQAEKNLDAEKAKTAALEARLAALKAQIADAQNKNDAAKPPVAGGKSSDAQSLYKDIVRRYLAGDWEKLADDAAAREKDFTTLPEEERADIAYIKDVLAECHQEWWDAVKDGKGGPFKATIWKHDLTFNFVNSPIPKFTPGTSTAPATVSWPREQMDSFDGLSMQDVGLMVPANFRKGDAISLLGWSYMAFADIRNTVGADKMRSMNAADKDKLSVYGGFWVNVTAGYYGTPPARRLVMVEALASFEKLNDTRPDWKGRRPIGAAVLLETKAHKYPSLNTGALTVLGLDRDPDPHEAEMFAAKPMVLGMAGTKFTLAEDKQWRELFKTLGEANQDWTAEQIALPNGLAYNFDADADVPLAQQRLKGGK